MTRGEVSCSCLRMHAPHADPSSLLLGLPHSHRPGRNPAGQQCVGAVSTRIVLPIRRAIAQLGNAAICWSTGSVRMESRLRDRTEELLSRRARTKRFLPRLVRGNTCLDPSLWIWILRYVIGTARRTVCPDADPCNSQSMRSVPGRIKICFIRRCLLAGRRMRPTTVSNVRRGY